MLHTLRTRGFVTPEGFAQSIGVHPAEILARLVADGHVRHIEKTATCTRCSRQARSFTRRSSECYADEPVRTGLAAPYERFLELNDHFKRLCTDWQLRDGAPNDHNDRRL